MNFDDEIDEIDPMSSLTNEHLLDYNSSYVYVNYINETIEKLHLLCGESHRNLTTELTAKTDYFCNASSDSILCWPPTPLNTTAVQKCFAMFNNVRYDDTRK